MGPVEIAIPEVVPSLNRLLRLHWSARRRLKKKWEWIMFAAIYGMGGPMSVPKGKLSVHITRSYYRVPLDPDNLTGSAKILLDAMKAVKILVDDSPAHIALTCDQEQGAPRTVIRLASC